MFKHKSNSYRESHLKTKPMKWCLHRRPSASVRPF
uniref:Uncharacterized protein n=1 Tax=Anguilla anguilla TaxID=7936 RepID=A0A0E9QK62_ANGAN